MDIYTKGTGVSETVKPYHMCTQTKADGLGAHKQKDSFTKETFAPLERTIYLPWIPLYIEISHPFAVIIQTWRIGNQFH